MNQPLDTLILSIRNGAEAYASNTWAGFKTISEDQTDRIRIAMEQGATSERLPHDLRILMLRAIFENSQVADLRTNGPRLIESTRDLSCAQAMALIDALYGHPLGGLQPYTPLSEQGCWLIRELASAVRAEQRAAREAFVSKLAVFQPLYKITSPVASLPGER